MIENTALHLEMIRTYNEMAFTHKYIWGFIYKKNVYMAITDESVLPFVTCLDTSSRNSGYSLRFRPNNNQKIALLPSASVFCSEKYFNEVAKESKYNKGEVFERLITEYYGQKWQKDRVPFTEDGDITIDGIPYQIKFQQATFCSEKSLLNLRK